MKNTFKYRCPICGCEEYYTIDGVREPGHNSLIEYDLYIIGDAQVKSNTFSTSFSTRVCKSCGHIDLFKDPSHLERQVDEHKKMIEGANQEIKSIEEEIEKLNLEKKKNEERLDFLNNQLESDEITVKQQKEYEEELIEVKDHLGISRKEMNILEDRLRKAQEKKVTILKTDNGIR